MDAKAEKTTRAAKSAKNLKRKKEETPVSDMAAAGGDNANAKKNHPSPTWLEGDKDDQEIDIQFPVTQEQLEELAASQRGKMATQFTIETDDDDQNVLDFGTVAFPNLEVLEIKRQSIKALNFKGKNYPNLTKLTIDGAGCASGPEYADFELPQLETVDFEYFRFDDSKGFGKSLSRSPKLMCLGSYKLWGLGLPGKQFHTLVLPNCGALGFWRADTLERLKLWAPRLDSLDLRACFAIKEVVVLDEKPQGYKGVEYVFAGTPSSYEVSLLNAPRPRGNLLTHWRFRGLERHSDVDEDDDEWSFS